MAEPSSSAAVHLDEAAKRPRRQVHNSAMQVQSPPSKVPLVQSARLRFTKQNPNCTGDDLFHARLGCMRTCPGWRMQLCEPGGISVSINVLPRVHVAALCKPLVMARRSEVSRLPFAVGREDDDVLCCRAVGL